MRTADGFCISSGGIGDDFGICGHYSGIHRAVKARSRVCNPVQRERGYSMAFDRVHAEGPGWNPVKPWGTYVVREMHYSSLTIYFSKQAIDTHCNAHYSMIVHWEAVRGGITRDHKNHRRRRMVFHQSAWKPLSVQTPDKARESNGKASRERHPAGHTGQYKTTGRPLTRIIHHLHDQD